MNILERWVLSAKYGVDFSKKGKRKKIELNKTEKMFQTMIKETANKIREKNKKLLLAKA